MIIFLVGLGLEKNLSKNILYNTIQYGQKF